MPQIVEVPVFRVKPSTYVNTVIIEQSGPLDIFFRCPARRAVKVRAGRQAPTSTKAADDCQQEPCRGGSNDRRGGESKQVRIASIPCPSPSQNFPRRVHVLNVLAELWIVRQISRLYLSTNA